MTTKQAQEKLKPFIKECVKSGNEYYVLYHDKKEGKNLVKANISDSIAVGILVEIINAHPEAFNYIIDEMNKKKVIAKA